MCTEEKLHLILDHCETLYKRLWSKKTFRDFCSDLATSEIYPGGK